MYRWAWEWDEWGLGCGTKKLKPSGRGGLYDKIYDGGEFLSFKWSTSYCFLGYRVAPLVLCTI